MKIKPHTKGKNYNQLLIIPIGITSLALISLNASNTIEPITT